MRGKIINITSVHEDIPRAGAADYCASKGGLRNLTRFLALELAEDGITVNNIAPGMVLTPMNQEAIDDPKVREEQTASIPMKRAAQPEEVAELALYLASRAGGLRDGCDVHARWRPAIEPGARRLMPGWELVSIAPLTMHRSNRLANMYVLSPFVWRQDGVFHLLVRAVPRRDDEPRLKMAEIWHGVSEDGLQFDMEIAPVIFPGPDLVDLDGCEDPTVRTDGGALRV